MNRFPIIQDGKLVGAVHLIDTGDGLTLIDSGYLGAAHLPVDGIWRAVDWELDDALGEMASEN